MHLKRHLHCFESSEMIKNNRSKASSWNSLKRWDIGKSFLYVAKFVFDEAFSLFFLSQPPSENRSLLPVITGHLMDTPAFLYCWCFILNLTPFLIDQQTLKDAISLELSVKRCRQFRTKINQHIYDEQGLILKGKYTKPDNFVAKLNYT